MDYYVGIDVSLEASSICVVDGAGKIIKEAKLSSEPEAFTAWFKALRSRRLSVFLGPASIAEDTVTVGKSKIGFWRSAG